MKELTQYINEWLIKKKVNKVRTNYLYHPKTKSELHEVIKELFNKNENNLNCIDVSNIDDMGSLFASIYYIKGCRELNADLSNWDVSNVTNMNGMFYNCEKFKGEGLENWNVSNVKDISYMFKYCINFDCDLSNWDVSNVEDMSSMFENCKKLDCNLETWDVSNCEDIRYMFDGCTSLKNKPSWYKG